MSKFLICEITEDDGRMINHCQGYDGNDYTLCGMALEGFGLDFGQAVFVEGVITCRKCANLIRFCKKIRNNRISSESLI